MLTFYNHRGIRVTDEWITVDDRRYPVRELEDLRITRGPINRPALWGMGTGGSLLSMTVVLALVLPGLMVVALGTVGLVVLGGAAILLRLRPRERCLWGCFRGTDELLIATTDEIELGKLRRALRRTLERDARFQRVSPRRRLQPAA